MSDSGIKWVVEDDGSGILNWVVIEYKDGQFSRVIATNEDKPTAHRIAAVNELEAALEMIRFQWAGHSEVCASISSKQCDCDWPKVAAQCDAAFAKARGDQ